MARIAGAGTLIVAGTTQDTSRLEVARKLGATHAIDIQSRNITEFMREIGDGLGAEVVIDAAGASAALKTALDIVRPGGHITKVGWGPQPVDASLDPLVKKGVRLQGSFSHNFPIWEKVITLLGSGKLDPRVLVGRIEPLEGWRACFDDMADGRIVKGVLNPS